MKKTIEDSIIVFFLALSVLIMAFFTNAKPDENYENTKADIQKQRQKRAEHHEEKMQEKKNDLKNLGFFDILRRYKSYDLYKKKIELREKELNLDRHKTYLQFSTHQRNKLVKDTNINISGEKIDINLACKKDLIKIKGIGEVIADRIIKKREKLGYFTSVEKLQDVKGVGEKKIKEITKK